MYFNRVMINGNLVEDPQYFEEGTRNEWCILRFQTSKPMRRDEDGKKKWETIFYNIYAYEQNASSIKEKVGKGWPLLVEAEIRNLDDPDDPEGRSSVILRAVRIHMHDRPIRDRVDPSFSKRDSVVKKPVEEEQGQEKKEQQVEKKEEKVDGQMNGEGVAVKEDVQAKQEQKKEEKKPEQKKKTKKSK